MEERGIEVEDRRMGNSEIEIKSERVDEMPVLIEQLKRMRVAEIIDEKVEKHHLWEGMSKGWTSLVWLAHIMKSGDHRKVHVQRILNESRESLSQLVGQEIRESEFNDDRLGRVLYGLGQDGRAEEIEQLMNQHCLRYYQLGGKGSLIRIDSTSVSVYGSVYGGEGGEEGGLMVGGYSKDHRPDLLQFKVLMSSLDPLGLPLLSQMVAGNASDDGLYIPAYDEASQSIGNEVMVVGDSKMSALGTRAHIQKRGGNYICPLSMVGKIPQQMEEWVKTAVEGSVRLQVLKSADGKPIGKAYEFSREQSHSDEGGQVTNWIERVIVARSDNYAKSQQNKLKEGLQAALQAIQALTAKSGRGHRYYRSAEELEAGVQGLIEQHRVQGLLDIQIKAQPQLRQVYPRPGRPSSTTQPKLVEEQRFLVKKAKVNQSALRQRMAHLGWRAYVSNAPAKEWPLDQVIAAYRAEWRIEHGFALLKGSPLSIAPVYLSKPQHIRGLLCLLSLALRALTLIQFTVAQALQNTGQTIKGISPAYPHQISHQPSAALILAAFNFISLTILHQAGQRFFHLPTLNPVQQQLLALLSFPADLYANLATANYPPNLSSAFSEW